MIQNYKSLIKAERFFQEELPKNIFCYVPNGDEVDVTYVNGDHYTYLNNPHNIDILKREMEKTINETYENATILQVKTQIMLSASMAMLMFIAITSKDMSLLILIYSVITIPANIINYALTYSLYKKAYTDKYLLENIEVLNKIIQEGSLKDANLEQLEDYLYNRELTIGDIRVLSNSSKNLVKKINEVKNEKRKNN